MQIKRESLAFVLIASIIITCSAVGAVQVFSTTVPICFIQNDGQTDDQVLYFADGAGYTLYLTAEGEVISTADPVSVVEITYPGSTAAIAVSGENELPGKANFLIGNDEEKWVTNVPMYGSVGYDGLYEGISLVYHGGVSTLKKEFILEPGTDPSAIRMQYAGQDGLALDENGALLVTTAAGTFFEAPPVSYQLVDGAQVVVPSSFVLGEDGVVTFAVAAYDRTLPLVIDPQYNFSTYLGGAQDDRGAGVGMDDWGNVYIAGSTQSTQFPLANTSAFQEHLNGSWDIFASKFSPDGKQLLYSTYIGGKSEDLAYGMVVNNLSQEVTFTGSTKSTDYPNSYPGSQSYGGNTDAIVTRLNAAGNNYVWSRLINGNKTDVGTAVTLDDYFYNDAVVVGYTSSDNLSSSWLISGPLLNGAAPDGFVIVITSAGIYSRGRYLGSPSFDYAYGVAVDPAFGYDVWITGYTNSFDGFPTTPSAFRKENRGGYDVFITRLNWGDLSLGASTYLGGASNDYGMGIDYDGNGYPYVTGYTESPISPINLFPVMPNPTGFQTSFGGGQWDAFITKMQRDLSSMNYSTYLGGADEDKAYGIAVDANGTAFVTGYTMSTNFPTKYPTQASKGEGFRVPDAFITQMNQTGTGLLFSTYLGGTYFDEGKAIAITPDGLNITVTGYTESINFPTVNAYQPYLAGFSAVRFTDAFVTKIVKVVPVANFTGAPDTGCRPLTVYFNDTSTNSPTSWLWEFGDNNTSTLQNPNHTYITTGGAKNFTVNLTACNIDGCGYLSQVNFTRVCPPPFADFNATNVTGCLNWSNTTIQFNVTSYSGGVKTGPAKVWNWSWGDGTYNLTNFSNVNMSHTYTKVNGTSNFTVSLTYENTCCNNTTTKVEYIDIRDKPNASFYAIPTSGLIPLDVSFFDTSSGRPSSWFWRFGPPSEGNSTLQNPQHTYSTRGAYTVRLQACNFCGCDWQNNTSYIMAGVPNLTFSPGTLVVPTNDTTPITLKLEVAENGLSGYDLNVFWDDSVHGNITAVKFPPWATNSSYTPLPNYFVQIQAVDFMNQVNPGAMNVTLATFNLTGNISTFMSTIGFNVTPNQLDDDDGNPIVTNTIPANITVVRLLPFPGKNLTPTDPFNNQVYWDVNGNGHIDFDDVVTYFQNMPWTRNNQYRPFFNYNGNPEVAPNYGIDFADLIMLFNKVGSV